MRRRASFGAIGALLTTPLAIAQSVSAMRRIAILEAADRASSERLWRLFEERFRELGYVEGRNLVVDRRWADGSTERLPQLAQELLAGKPEVVLVTGTPTTRAFMQLTRTVPIVMVGVADPVATGLVASLTRPGGNVTGFSLLQAETTLKRLDLLREIIPGAKRFGLLGPARDAGLQSVWKRLDGAARPRGLEVRLLDADDAQEVAREFERFGAEPVDALIVTTALRQHYRQIVELAARFRIPASYAHKEPLDAGGLLVYAPERDAVWRHAAEYAHRILQGAIPAEMPVQQPTEFWLGVNLRTARALGLKVPQAVVLRADRVID